MKELHEYSQDSTHALTRQHLPQSPLLLLCTPVTSLTKESYCGAGDASDIFCREMLVLSQTHSLQWSSWKNRTHMYMLLLTSHVTQQAYLHSLLVTISSP